MKVFQYVLFYVNEDETGKKTTKLIKDVTTVLAENEQVVSVQAARAIPADYENELDKVQIAIRSF